VESAMKLLAEGHAYPDYVTKEQLDDARKAAEAAKRPFIYRGDNRDNPPEKNQSLYAEKPTVLRFKVPTGRTVVINDLIRQRGDWQTDLIGDSVILRADKTPLYNFATVVDDAAMKITHIIRASEHLSNTPIQVLIFEALGEPVPQFAFAHVPVVNEPAPKPGSVYPPGVKPP